MPNFLNTLGGYFVPYLSEISTALIACALVMFGGEINRMLRNALRMQHFLIRTSVFILINAFGYGLIIVKATPYLARTLLDLERGIMFSIIISSFIVIGIWAQKNRQI
ncbi:DUF3392 domain-containing protein [Vibrio sp. SCSIO 43135]|uniref:DUF3392 domain-containing protein n=1 Tax=Vibrio paucivorans TaxID=2829489 RepID=A0A9X3HTN2_9VIBR|nr:MULTISPECIES: DUF3392 domain-containing protein [Vibrio]MCW8335814.1 DUF3392 domain-containing protein [Vibrio paucivorans]USD42225.1 DUF3392 domain-containing protein [Vibrio sp. SCSIO 43135]